MRRDFGKIQFQPVRNKLENIFPVFGPEFRIEMRITLLGLSQDFKIAFELFSVETFSLLSIHSNGILDIFHAINPDLQYSSGTTLLKDTPYQIIIEQSMKSGKMIYEIKINKELVYSIENTNPQTYINAELYLSNDDVVANVFFDYFFIHCGHGNLDN